VVARQRVVANGPFRAEYPYCPDEEAFLRWAREGGLALDPTPLYRVRTHQEQARYETWLMPDFVSTYVNARVQGAAGFTPAVIDLARRSSAQRVVSIAVSLALSGRPAAAASRLDELLLVAPASRTWPRLWLARAASRHRLWRELARMRRKRVLRRRVS
jgi:hypothetical protein